MNDAFTLMTTPTARRPLLGLTILLVEDSRFSCEAVRLLCLHSGARLRRADCITSARRHLQVYRPSVAIIDLGLPDGSGAELIDELDKSTPRVEAIFGTSGDDMAEALCMAAGADGFISKPMSQIAAFQSAILTHLPETMQPDGVRPINTGLVEPDAVAYRDDMAHISELLGDSTDKTAIKYLSQFVTGVANSAGDAALARAGQALGTARANGAPVTTHLAKIAGLVQERMEGQMAL